jgi:hypothetical protein
LQLLLLTKPLLLDMAGMLLLLLLRTQSEPDGECALLSCNVSHHRGSTTASAATHTRLQSHTRHAPAAHGDSSKHY